MLSCCAQRNPKHTAANALAGLNNSQQILRAVWTTFGRGSLPERRVDRIPKEGTFMYFKIMGQMALLALLALLAGACLLYTSPSPRD